MLKIKIITFLLLLQSIVCFGQDIVTVLSAPEEWKSEIIPFPLNFAPSIALEGFEDLRFAPEWSDSASQNFWCYSFVWYILHDSSMTDAKITKYLCAYYDGLMGVVNKNKEVEIDETICLVVKSDEGFVGKMRVYDSFFTKSYITLNIKIIEIICKQTSKQIIRFDVSPQHVDNSVWNIFEKVKIKNICE